VGRFLRRARATDPAPGIMIGPPSAGQENVLAHCHGAEPSPSRLALGRESPWGRETERAPPPSLLRS
jgi:hypothetical protein